MAPLAMFGPSAFRMASKAQFIAAQFSTRAFGSSLLRRAATDSPQHTPAVSPKPKIRWLKTKIVVGLFVAANIFDNTLNDDWDTVLDRIRPGISESERARRPKVVILGTGWGALNLLRKINADQYQVSIVSPRNYFLFTPLLPSTCAGAIDTRCIIEPIREYCRRANASHATFYEAECTKIDHENNKLHCTRSPQGVYREKGPFTSFELEYDYLVVAVGTQSATFGIPGVKENALFMKEAPDGRRLRGRIIDSLESANIPGNEDDLQRLLHFVVVGGGPTGVECAAELHDFVDNEVKEFFPDLRDKVTITLIEALPNVLSMFSKSLVEYAEQKFHRDDIDVLTRTLVTKVDQTHVYVKKLETGEVSKMPYGTLLWASGVATRPVVSDLMKAIGAENGQTSPRALTVDGKMLVKGTENIFALGDCAFINLPPTAQVAAQEGKYLGRVLRKAKTAMIQDKETGTRDAFRKYMEQAPSFEYSHMGAFAYLGDNAAIADFTTSADSAGGILGTSAGTTTYFLWRSVYFTKLLSFRNRVLVCVNWVFTEIFGRDTSRR
eukprot:CFRG1846T1